MCITLSHVRCTYTFNSLILYDYYIVFKYLMFISLYKNTYDINSSDLKCKRTVIKNMVKQVNYENIKQHLNNI